MKDIEIEFVFGFENNEYAALHRIAKSKGSTVEQYLIKCFGEMVKSWELGGIKNEIDN
jgi:hypothetical protein